MSSAKFVPPAPTAPPAASGTLGVRVLRAAPDRRLDKDDRVVVEAPLEFQLHHHTLGTEPASFGATMRTPGDDESLAAGLLYGEGVVETVMELKHVGAPPGVWRGSLAGRRPWLPKGLPATPWPPCRSPPCALRRPPSSCSPGWG